MPKLSADEVERRRAIVLASSSNEQAAQAIGVHVRVIGEFRHRYMPMHRWNEKHANCRRNSPRGDFWKSRAQE